MSQATNTPTTPTRRAAIGLSVAAFAAGLTAPARAKASDALCSTEGAHTPDAELIALCDRFVQNETKQASLYVTISDEDERDLALEPLLLEWRNLLDQIEQLDGPTTMAGAKAMARAALATCPRNLNGELEVGGDPEGWFHIAIAQFLVGDAA